MCRCKRLRACRIRSARVFLVMILSLPRRRHLSGAFFQHNNKARGCLFPRRGTYGLHTRGNVTAPGTPLLSGEPARASRARDHHAQSLTCAGTSWKGGGVGRKAARRGAGRRRRSHSKWRRMEEEERGVQRGLRGAYDALRAIPRLPRLWGLLERERRPRGNGAWQERT